MANNRKQINVDAFIRDIKEIKRYELAQGSKNKLSSEKIADNIIAGILNNIDSHYYLYPNVSFYDDLSGHLKENWQS